MVAGRFFRAGLSGGSVFKKSYVTQAANKDCEEKMIHFEILSQIRTVTQTGIGLGSAIAVVPSWDRNRSILFAIIHGILSWIYVIYFALTREDNENKV